MSQKQQPIPKTIVVQVIDTNTNHIEASINIKCISFEDALYDVESMLNLSLGVIQVDHLEFPLNLRKVNFQQTTTQQQTIKNDNT